MNAHHFPKPLNHARWAVLLLALQSCAIVQSSKVDLTRKPSPTIDTTNKLAYFLPTGQLRLKLAERDNAGVKECEFTLETVYAPDINNLYFVEYNPSAFSNDKNVKIAIGSSGFLTSIETQTQDKTSEILAKVFELGKTIVLRSPSGPRAAAPEGAKPPPPCRMDVTIDPFTIAANAKQGIVERLKAWHPSITDFGVELANGSRSPANWQTAQRDHVDGIVHRPALPYLFRLTTDDPLANLAPQFVYLPNEAPMFTIDIKRRAFVENKHSLTFTNGMLTEIAWTKPSEALGFVNIPLDIAKAIVAIPGELLSVKVNSATSETNLLNAQRNLLEAKDQLLRKIQELESKNGK